MTYTSVSKEDYESLIEEYISKYNSREFTGKDIGELKRNGETPLIRFAAYMAYMRIATKEANELCDKMEADRFRRAEKFKKFIIPVAIILIVISIGTVLTICFSTFKILSQL